jgi:biotin transporter BioY
MMLCVVPFLPGDVVKIAIAIGVGPGFRKRIGGE